MNLAYPAKLEPQKDGSVLVTFPDLPFVVTDGDDEADALIEAADALVAGIATCISEREDIPVPSPARGRPLVPVEPELAAKAALYMAMREAKVTNVALARDLGVTEGAVRSMLDPQRTAKIGTLAKALRQLGFVVTVSVGPLTAKPPAKSKRRLRSRSGRIVRRRARRVAA